MSKVEMLIKEYKTLVEEGNIKNKDRIAEILNKIELYEKAFCDVSDN